MSDADDFKKQEEEWKQQLLENPKVQAFFAKHKKGSEDRFIEGYVNFKRNGLLNGKLYGERLDREETEGVDTALQHLKAIQHKKLFDLQCQWRAGMVDVPEIISTFDFTLWSYKIMDCPFLEPVSETEVEWYAEFLSTQEEMPDEYFFTWQNYDDFKANYDDDDAGDELPEWYEFHNMKTGNSVFLTYNNIRGEQEDLYYRLKHEADSKGKPAPEPIVDEDADKPWLKLYDDKVFLEVADFVEDPRTLRLMKAYQKGTEKFHTREYEQTQDDISYLANIKDELIPIQAHSDYREALHLAVERHRIDKVIRHLPAAYRKYLWMRDNDFSLSDEREIQMFNTFNKHSKDIKDSLDEGRRLNGEL